MANVENSGYDFAGGWATKGNFLGSQKSWAPLIFVQKWLTFLLSKIKVSQGEVVSKIAYKNQYVNNYSYALDFFGYDHQKYKNRKPDRKPDPGPGNFKCCGIQ